MQSGHNLTLVGDYKTLFSSKLKTVVFIIVEHKSANTTTVVSVNVVQLMTVEPVVVL